MSDFFPARSGAKPTIYAYKLVGVVTHANLLKVGYTTRDVRERVSEQLGTSHVEYRIVFEASAMRADGTAFTDREVHALLARRGFEHVKGEWFKCAKKDVEAAVLTITRGEELELS